MRIVCSTKAFLDSWSNLWIMFPKTTGYVLGFQKIKPEEMIRMSESVKCAKGFALVFQTACSISF